MIVVGEDSYNSRDLFFDHNFDIKSSSYYEGQLCIPQDSLEDLEFFDNFSDDSNISLSEFLLIPEQATLGVEDCPLPFSSMEAKPEQTEEQQVELNMMEPEAKVGRKRTRSKRRRVVDSWGQKIPNNWSLSEKQSPSGGEKKRRRRRCRHCQSEKTPQWRMGPEGPNTLCNACGVRYKAGKLVPEYRPAKSPSFDALKHSNFHRKILKRRGIL
ncbi:GATA transcription factor 12 [Camellia lanceoleosa]|uniref:GATA transcription factor 12 n=1 Tax=Camellia lanceoleosa TaxID=1840588 RepID=A0ACC0J5M0_9ERIC|nr:GATA transcription factor 12 [Camellia lanceoleosa]